MFFRNVAHGLCSIKSDSAGSVAAIRRCWACDGDGDDAENDAWMKQRPDAGKRGTALHVLLFSKTYNIMTGVEGEENAGVNSSRNRPLYLNNYSVVSPQNQTLSYAIVQLNKGTSFDQEV